MDTLTIKEAQRNGFAIDKHCYPHLGYKGARFAPDLTINVYTELECELKEDLEDALNRVEDMYRNDDGQAWKEAEKFLRKHNRTEYL